MRASSAVSAFAALLFALLVGIYHEYTHKPPNPVDINEMETFSNFGQTFTMRFGQPPKGSGLPRNKFSQPTSEKEIVDTVRAAAKAGHVVRVFGAGHSWTPLVAGSKNRATHLLNLDNYNRLVAVDVEKRQATVQAGIRVRQLTRSLASVGLGLSNMGTIDEQSIAGAISTSTHGSGIRYGSLSSMVVAMRLVIANGTILDINEGDLLDAARVSLGALGIISTVTLQLEPMYNIHRVYTPIPEIDKALGNWNTTMHKNEHAKLWWLPHSKYGRLAELNRTPAKPSPFLPLAHLVDRLQVSFVVGVSHLTSMFVPSLRPKLFGLIGRFAQSHESVVGPYYEVFPLSSVAPYNESEWFVPIENAVEAFQLFRTTVTENNCPLNMISELRSTKADSNWLSPMFGRDSAAINLLIKGEGREFERCMKLVDNALLPYGARPHWGKNHVKDAAAFASLYPKWKHFTQLRRELDPEGVFLNDYLQSLFMSGD